MEAFDGLLNRNILCLVYSQGPIGPLTAVSRGFHKFLRSPSFASDALICRYGHSNALEVALAASPEHMKQEIFEDILSKVTTDDRLDDKRVLHCAARDGQEKILFNILRSRMARQGTACGGDMDAALDWLRAKGLSKAAKKADRVAAEGLVAVAQSRDGKAQVGALVELNAETDFVARNELFQAAARGAAQAALSAANDVDAVKAATTPAGEVVSDVITGLIATIGENMVLRRSARFAVTEGVVAAYVHNAIAPDLGRMGVLVALESSADADKLNELGRKIGMHVAATAPLALTVEEVDPAAVERERAIFAEQAAESGKPANVVEKMIEGRIRKFYEEVVLLKQAFVMNPDQTVEQLIAEQAKTLGAPIKIVGFTRLALGEGVEKKVDDFAGEVAALTGQA